MAEEKIAARAITAEKRGKPVRLPPLQIMCFSCYLAITILLLAVVWSGIVILAR